MDCIEVIGGIKMESPIVKLEEPIINKVNVVEISVKDLKSEYELGEHSDDENVIEIGIEDITNVELIKQIKENMQSAIQGLIKKEEFVPDLNETILKEDSVLYDAFESSEDDVGSSTEKEIDEPRLISNKIESITNSRAEGIRIIYDKNEKNVESPKTDGKINDASNQFHTKQQTGESMIPNLDKNKSNKTNQKENNLQKIVDRKMLEISSNNQNIPNSREANITITRIHRNGMTNTVSSSKRYAPIWCPVKDEYSTEDEDNYFSCYNCDYKAKTISSVKQHELIHIPKTQIRDRLHKCPHCPVTYKSKSSLVSHVKFIHEKAEVVKLWCKLCTCAYTRKNSLEYHMSVHHKDPAEQETLKCYKCSYKTITSRRLSIHMKNTHGSMDFQCHICSYRATTYGRLKLHLIGHKKDKDQDMKYLCDQCGYKTYRCYSLQVHKLNHLKPEEVEYFCCYHCDFKAKRKDNLKSHIIRHFKKEDVTLSCYVCDFTTKKRNKLTYHIEKHTKELKEEK